MMPQIPAMIRAGVKNGAIRQNLRHHLGRVFHQQPEAFFAFAERGEHLAPLPLFLSLKQGAPHGRGQARDPVLQDIIGGAFLEALDGHFLAHAAGDEDEGDFRRAAPRDFQGGEAVKSGQAVVSQDDVELVAVECANELGPGFHPLQLARNPFSLKNGTEQLGKAGIIFKRKDTHRHSLHIHVRSSRWDIGPGGLNLRYPAEQVWRMGYNPALPGAQGASSAPLGSTSAGSVFIGLNG